MVDPTEAKQLNFIFDSTPKAALIDQLGEECDELGLICHKAARKIRGESPTPAKTEDIQENLVEELADVKLCMAVIELFDFVDSAKINEIIREKTWRWQNRIQAMSVAVGDKNNDSR